MIKLLRFFSATDKLTISFSRTKSSRWFSTNMGSNIEKKCNCFYVFELSGSLKKKQSNDLILQEQCTIAGVVTETLLPGVGPVILAIMEFEYLENPKLIAFVTISLLYILKHLVYKFNQLCVIGANRYRWKVVLWF